MINIYNYNEADDYDDWNSGDYDSGANTAWNSDPDDDYWIGDQDIW